MFRLNDKPELAFPRGADGLSKVPARFRYTSTEILPALLLILAQWETCLCFRIITPNYWCYIILWVFLVVLPGFFWSLSKSFTATVLWEEQLAKSEDRDKVSEGRIWPGGSSKSQSLTLIYSPPNLAQTWCQLLRWCQLWWVNCWGGLGPGSSSWGYCLVTSVSLHGGVIQTSTVRWEAAASWQETFCSFERLLCTTCKTFKKMMRGEVISLVGTMVFPSHKKSGKALAHFNYHLEGSGAFPLPLPFFFSFL